MERVKVRIAVAVDEVGNWYGCGGSALEVADSISLAKSGVPIVGPSLFWLEAELPVPCIKTVAANVVEAKNDE